MKENGLNVLSLFDGISCAKLALDKAGIKIKKYYSSEIDKSALAVQSHHYSRNSNFIQLGDIRGIDGRALKDIDLVVFGSPCTNLTSINYKDRRGLEGDESKLFYEALRILRELNSTKPIDKKLYVLMENVASMSKINAEKITTELKSVLEDIQLLKVDSELIAPAHRRRLYWTNIPGVTIPEPIKIKYGDVIENGFVDKEKANVVLSSNVTLTKGIYRHYEHSIGNIIFKDENFASYSTREKLAIYPFVLELSNYKSKSGITKKEYDFPNGCYRLPSIKELSRLMTIPDHYLCEVDSISRTEKERLTGLSFTVDVIAHLLRPLKII
ncbi:MAG TPA: DNA cytosine methyltransferase [Chitinophagales bacterium]|nr:DNA cytosine methyltransferase [Chitinophagales bacterium]